jgi:hypothetical protein
MSPLETPVAMIAFNRPGPTRRVFEAIRAARPTRLFLITDGRRATREGEAELCEAVKRIVTAVDWPCHVTTNFSAENLGCYLRFTSGLEWLFSQVEEAIILEDDCLPDPSFFPFCAELLERHRNDLRVALISGFNPLENEPSIESSYFYSHPVFPFWGWATWRRTWEAHDDRLPRWPEVKRQGLVGRLFPDKRVIAYWSRIFESMYTDPKPNTWDYQLVYTCWMRNWLTVVPSRNLVQNIGFGENATHTTGPDPDRDLAAGSVSFPLRHPAAMTSWHQFAMKAQRRFYTPSIAWRIRRRILMGLRER